MPGGNQKVDFLSKASLPLQVCGHSLFRVKPYGICDEYDACMQALIPQDFCRIVGRG